MQALQEENEKLKKENEMLKERMDYLRAVQATHIDDINDTHAKYRDMVLTLKTQKNKLSKKNTELRKEIKEVKEENERLEEELHAYKNTEYDDIQNIQELNEEIEKLKKENEKLNKENEKLEEEMKARKSLCNHFEMMNKKNYEDKMALRKEIETLKTN